VPLLLLHRGATATATARRAAIPAAAATTTTAATAASTTAAPAAAMSPVTFAVSLEAFATLAAIAPLSTIPGRVSAT
jgi:hypothetical protein